MFRLLVLSALALASVSGQEEWPVCYLPGSSPSMDTFGFGLEQAVATSDPTAIAGVVAGREAAAAAHCSGGPTLTKDQVLAMATAGQWGPVLIMHPDEELHPISAEEFLSKASLHDKTTDAMLADAPMTPAKLAAVGGDLSLTYLTAPSTKYGAPYVPNPTDMGATELSTAPIYVHYAEKASGEPATYPFDVTYSAGHILHYSVFFADNDCSSLEFFSRGDPNTYLLAYLACDFGTHEGDWEPLQVEVCPDGSNILSVGYGHHGNRQVLDCTAGECALDPVSGSPIAFVARGTHGLYPIASTGIISAQATLAAASFQYFNSIDQTAQGNKMWVPTGTNILPIGNVEDYSFDSTAMDWSVPSWVAYAGDWGGKNDGAVEPVKCFNTDRTRVVSCSSMDANAALVQFLLGSPAAAAAMGDGQLTRVGPNGPAFKSFYNQLDLPGNLASTMTDLELGIVAFGPGAIGSLNALTGEVFLPDTSEAAAAVEAAKAAGAVVGSTGVLCPGPSFSRGYGLPIQPECAPIEFIFAAGDKFVTTADSPVPHSDVVEFTVDGVDYFEVASSVGPLVKNGECSSSA